MQAIGEFHRRFKRLYPQKQSIIYLDETYFRINGRTLLLILVCDAPGKILAWKLSRKLSSQVLSEILEESLIQHPNWSVLITDGAPVYQAAFRRLGAGVLVQQVHSRPWKDVIVTQFELGEKSMKLLQIELPFDVFTKASSCILKALTFSRNYFRSGTKKRRARKKSSRKPPRKPARKQKQIYGLPTFQDCRFAGSLNRGVAG